MQQHSAFALLCVEFDSPCITLRKDQPCSPLLCWTSLICLVKVCLCACEKNGLNAVKETSTLRSLIQPHSESSSSLLTCFSSASHLFFFILSLCPFYPSLLHVIPFPTFHYPIPLISLWFHVCYSLASSSTLSFLQVAALQEEKSSLLAENQVLMERLNQSDSIEDINSPAGRRHLQLQTQLEQLQEETFRCGMQLQQMTVEST